MDGNQNPPGPGLLNSRQDVDIIGFVLEVIAVQFFQVWLVVTVRKLENCPFDEWTMGQQYTTPRLKTGWLMIFPGKKAKTEESHC